MKDELDVTEDRGLRISHMGGGLPCRGCRRGSVVFIQAGVSEEINLCSWCLRNLAKMMIEFLPVKEPPAASK